MANDVVFAQNRFGLGPRGDEPPAGGDGRAWVLDQFAKFRPAVEGAPSRQQVADALADYIEVRRDARQNQQDTAPTTNPPTTDGGARRPQGQAVDPRVKATRLESRQAYLSLVEARVRSALNTPAPFLERMSHFWANHFAVSAQKVQTVGFAGLLEVEAIRPHVMGRFGDMLLAVEQHPAMLFYLDQAQSIGPGSRLGQAAARRGRTRGLNENLAREILELHTLGVRSGYSQADVTEFARALTGWTVAGVGRGPMAQMSTGRAGDFQFVDGMHEPGDRTIMGRTYRSDGEGQARAVLDMLAVHPATARHVATKLARHFAADDPPPAMVARLEQAFLSSGGDLPTVYRALVASPEAWNATRPKFRDPWDWAIASLRAVGASEMPGQMAFATMRELGQPVWQPPSPAGWDDIAASWAGPDALVRRVEVAQRIAQRAGEAVDARTLAPRVLGSGLSDRTASAIGRSESAVTGLALLLASPEMLRR